MKLKNLKSWKIFGTKLVKCFLGMLLLGVVLNCGGTRKANTQKKEIKSDSISVENRLVLKQNIVLRDIGSVRPFDPAKPIIVDGKEYFNCIIDFDKSQFYNFEIDSSHKEIKIAKEISVKDKQVEKTDYTLLWCGLFFIFCFFVCLYFYLPTLKFDYMKKL